jgi:hypothetical protein
LSIEIAIYAVVVNAANSETVVVTLPPIKRAATSELIQRPTTKFLGNGDCSNQSLPALYGSLPSANGRLL